MARPTRARKDKIVTNKGIYKDVLANVLDVLSRAFETKEELRKFKPRHKDDRNPKKVNLKETPALFVWCDGSTASSPSAGQLSGRSVHKKREFHVSIMYILSEVENAESDDELLELASALEEVIDTNLDLNGLMNGPSERVETTLFPEPLLFNDQWKMVSNVQINMIYGKTDRQKTATR